MNLVSERKIAEYDEGSFLHQQEMTTKECVYWWEKKNGVL